MGMFNEVYAPCPECGGEGVMQVRQYVGGFGEFRLLDPSTFAELEPHEREKLFKDISEGFFHCRQCGSYFDIKSVSKEGALDNDELVEISEELSERAHEQWMEREKAKGNTDNEHMVLYEELSEEDKESDRDYAHQFLDVLDERGYEVVEGGLTMDHREAEAIDNLVPDEMVKKVAQYTRDEQVQVYDGRGMPVGIGTIHDGPFTIEVGLSAGEEAYWVKVPSGDVYSVPVSQISKLSSRGKAVKVAQYAKGERVRVSGERFPFTPGVPDEKGTVLDGPFTIEEGLNAGEEGYWVQTTSGAMYAVPVSQISKLSSRGKAAQESDDQKGPEYYIQIAEYFDVLEKLVDALGADVGDVRSSRWAKETVERIKSGELDASTIRTEAEQANDAYRLLDELRQKYRLYK